MSILNLFAAGSDCKKAGGLDACSLPGSSVQSFTDGRLDTIFKFVIGVVAVIAVLIIVLAGFKYITSSGDPQGVASAKKAILYSAIGLVVCGLAWSIVTFVIKGV